MSVEPHLGHVGVHEAVEMRAMLGSTIASFSTHVSSTRANAKACTTAAVVSHGCGVVCNLVGAVVVLLEDGI